MNHQDFQDVNQSRDWPFDIRPLSPALGAELVGIDLEKAASKAVFPAVFEAFLKYQLILFSDINLPAALQIKFARNFGEV